MRGESAAQDLVNVLGVLEGAPELRDLLQRVERDLNRYAGERARGRGCLSAGLPLAAAVGHGWRAALLTPAGRYMPALAWVGKQMQAQLPTLTCSGPPAALYAGSQPRRADGPYAELLPWLLEQAADWDVAATANVVGDTPLVRVSGTLVGRQTGWWGWCGLAEQLRVPLCCCSLAVLGNSP